VQLLRQALAAVGHPEVPNLIWVIPLVVFSKPLFAAKDLVEPCGSPHLCGDINARLARIVITQHARPVVDAVNCQCG